MNYVNTPFNYTGSKFKLLDQLLPEFDYSKKYFIDLFCGGGSVYANVLDKYDGVVINDVISDLIGIHKQLVDNTDLFVEYVKKICPSKTDKEAFISLRSDYNSNKTPEKLYALMLCCTNNMMRFNKKFEFNQTFGARSYNDNTEKKIYMFANHVSMYKNKLVYKSDNFYDLKQTSFNNFMVYLDPPYTETEAGYNSYWNESYDKVLYNYIKNIDNSGGSFVLSGIVGKHKKGKESNLINTLIDDGYNHKILICDYEKVARNKNTNESNEIIIKNF